MGLRILKERDGQNRPTFYGRYTDRDGKSVTENLEVKIAGKPPASLLDQGDPEFERSRGRALNELKKRKKEAVSKRVGKSDAVRTFKRSTAKELKQTSIDGLPDVLSEITPKLESPVWGKWRRKVVMDFVGWARREKIRYALDVTPADAKKYLLLQYQPDKEGYQKTVATVRKIKTILGRVFATALEEGAANPFKHDDVSIERAEGDTEHNRKPLTEEEIMRLLEEAKKDRMVYDLIVCGLCTGARRGDVARLTWKSVKLPKNVIEITTHKTGSEISVPILPRLREVIEARLPEKTAKELYVFPEAQRLIDTKPAQLSYRIKRIFALALSDGIEDAKPATETPERVNLSDVLPSVEAAIEQATFTESKRQKMIDLVRRYAQGETYRVMQRATGISRGGISDLLHLAEKASGHCFIIDKRPTFSIKRAIIDTTRESRKHGTRAASIYDFHALRTSFITTAIIGGIPVEIVKAITGHKLTETVIEHYLKPKGSIYHERFMKAMPESLTGRNPETRALPAASEDRLEEIAATLNSLTAEDRAKLETMTNRKAVK
jgi:integrase